MAATELLVHTDMDWGNESVGEDHVPADEFEHLTITEASTQDAEPEYFRIEPCVCAADHTTMLTRDEAQRFAKLRWEMRSVSIFSQMLIDKSRPSQAICAKMRQVPTVENVAHAFYQLVVRIGVCYDATRQNPNYPEFQYLDQWYRVHIQRANSFHSKLMECVTRFTQASSETAKTNAQDDFVALKANMARPLPNLKYC